MRPKNLVGREKALVAFRADPEATFRKLGAATGMTCGTVAYHLNILRAEGVISFTRQRGRRAPSVVIDPKKQAAGLQGKGSDAFHPKKSKKDTGLNSRIELVVRMAKEREGRGEMSNVTDVVMHSPIRLRGAMKVG